MYFSEKSLKFISFFYQTSHSASCCWLAGNFELQDDFDTRFTSIDAIDNRQAHRDIRYDFINPIGQLETALYGNTTTITNT